MIVFGTKSKVVQGHHVQGAECPDCGNRQFSSFRERRAIVSVSRD